MPIGTNKKCTSIVLTPLVPWGPPGVRTPRATPPTPPPTPCEVLLTEAVFRALSPKVQQALGSPHIHPLMTWTAVGPERDGVLRVFRILPTSHSTQVRTHPPS